MLGIILSVLLSLSKLVSQGKAKPVAGVNIARIAISWELVDFANSRLFFHYQVTCILNHVYQAILQYYNIKLSILVQELMLASWQQRVLARHIVQNCFNIFNIASQHISFMTFCQLARLAASGSLCLNLVSSIDLFVCSYYVCSFLLQKGVKYFFFFIKTQVSYVHNIT